MILRSIEFSELEVVTKLGIMHIVSGRLTPYQPGSNNLSHINDRLHVLIVYFSFRKKEFQFCNVVNLQNLS